MFDSTKLILSSLLILSFTVSKAQTPNYNDDIACILFEHCTECHHDGGIAPFSLMTYDEVSGLASYVRDAVNDRIMPPWPPNPEYNSLAHERLLTQEEIQLITEWANSGTPEGPGLPPQEPIYTADEAITDPDLELVMDEYTISTIGVDVFRCFVIPTSLNEDVFITELEIVPGNREAVHHVMLYKDETNVPVQLDNAEPGPGYTSFGSTGSEWSIPVAGWNPGQGKKVFPDGMGIRIPAGANMVMQIHYPGTANGQVDQSKVNIRYTTEPLREIHLSSFIHHFDLNEGALTIPPNEIRTFTGNYTLPIQQDITLLDVNVHMHLLGDSAISYAILPNNDTIPFVEISNWDFHWQGFYDFRQPIRIPGGTTFYGSCTYNNTNGNPDNPNSPPETVNMGDASDDEMMLVFFSYLDYEPDDEDIVVDTSTVHSHHECIQQIPSTGNVRAEDVEVFPNPTSGILQVRGVSGGTDYVISDAVGRRIHSGLIQHGSLDVSGLVDGFYLISISADHGTLQKRIQLAR